MTFLSKQKTFLNLFPVPEFLLLSTSGVAVSDTDTKFVQIRRKIFGDGLKLLHSMKIDNPLGTVESGLINNREALIVVLKKLFLRHNINYIHSILPEEKAYIFTAKIAKVPSEGMRDAVAFIIEANAPVSLAESVFDFEVISEDESSGEIKLAVCVLPESVVNAYIEIFESAGMTPISFDTESQAIARAVVQHGDKLPHLIINLLSTKTGFYVVEDEVVQFSTTLAYGAGDDNSDARLDEIRAEMRKVVTFWDSRTDVTENKIKKIILCGQGANDEDLVGRLMSEGEFDYTLADIWTKIFTSSEHISDVSFEESLEYVSVIGSVLPLVR